jgi:hypothetical protein
MLLLNSGLHVANRIVSECTLTLLPSLFDMISEPTSITLYSSDNKYYVLYTVAGYDGKSGEAAQPNRCVSAIRECDRQCTYKYTKTTTSYVRMQT